MPTLIIMWFQFMGSIPPNFPIDWVAFAKGEGKGRDPVECKRWWEGLQRRYIQPIRDLKPIDQSYEASVALFVEHATLDAILEGLAEHAVEGGSGSA